ncbi:hypothetical protein [Solitalea lacus]|uniref:hypothetical protein n=1 Tax=Solitalea lacus TaxID=2911172 RepID=UPI001EDADA1E|nr:hypothetical protein [Solitalea lacus]UKJ07920.1 hypothetical protein L2B55_01850 [Solitalea lacus]
MQNSNKSDRYYLEKYGPLLLSTVITVSTAYFQLYKKMDLEKLLDKSIDFSAICFGFLIAVLTLILQSDSSSVKKLKEFNKFNDLIKYNKIAVLLSAIVSVAAILLLSTKGMIESFCLVKTILYNLLIFLLSWQVIEVFKFLRLFYLIILSAK